MEAKTLYQFTLDKEVETEKESKRTNKKTGEVTITKRKVKEKKPIEVQIKRPSRRELEEAELEYSIEMSKCIKRGILTKAMLAKKYSDTGGLFSEEDAEKYQELYKNALDLQNEYVRLDSATKKTQKQKDRLEKVKKEVAITKKDIVEMESTFSSLFDHTADVKAQNRLILWYVLHLTRVYNEDDDSFDLYFTGDDFDEKIKSYHKLEESEDEFYFALINKVTTILAFWFFNQASSPKEFDELIEKMETGEL
tara:strand:+ start:2934 stop:3689 length:756 start_codon:yes stop_codon:yes gene_type:complete